MASSRSVSSSRALTPAPSLSSTSSASVRHACRRCRARTTRVSSPQVAGRPGPCPREPGDVAGRRPRAAGAPARSPRRAAGPAAGSRRPGRRRPPPPAAHRATAPSRWGRPAAGRCWSGRRRSGGCTGFAGSPVAAGRTGHGAPPGRFGPPRARGACKSKHPASGASRKRLGEPPHRASSSTVTLSGVCRSVKWVAKKVQFRVAAQPICPVRPVHPSQPVGASPPTRGRPMAAPPPVPPQRLPPPPLR